MHKLKGGSCACVPVQLESPVFSCAALSPQHFDHLNICGSGGGCGGGGGNLTRSMESPTKSKSVCKDMCAKPCKKLAAVLGRNTPPCSIPSKITEGSYMADKLSPTLSANVCMPADGYPTCTLDVSTATSFVEVPATTVPFRGNRGSLLTEAMESRVLVIYTGGTIGMRKDEGGALAPASNALVDFMSKNPTLHDKDYAHRKFGDKALKPPTLVLPLTNCKYDDPCCREAKEPENKRVLYSIVEYCPLLDSSNMSGEHWVKIANDIREAYECYHGFVVLHGTDTLAYTASALSFMLENLGKTVIITGSQIPVFESRSDGRDNLLGAVLLAGNYVVPEVCVFFNQQLFRGNRTTKVASSSLNAFDSPNCAPLVTFGIDVNVDYRSFFRQCGIEPFKVFSELNRNVGMLRLFPSITANTVRAFLLAPTEGCVLQSYGAGNVPSDRHDILDELRDASSRGVIIVNTSQCTRGGVAADLYATGAVLGDVGVLSGFDMTPEAALTKLSYVLAKDNWDIDMKRKMMQKNLRGELTPAMDVSASEADAVLLDAVAKFLEVQSPGDHQNLCRVLYPAIVNATVASGDVNKINGLQNRGVDVSAGNVDRRTPLHVACCEGNAEIVEALLKVGCNVHMTDRYDRTPLMDAINFDNHEVIRVLVKCGAHIVGRSIIIGEEINRAAANGNMKRLQSFALAGADFNQVDCNGRTALHMAVLYNQEEIIRFLLERNASRDVADILGDTPFNIAQKMNLKTAELLLQGSCII